MLGNLKAELHGLVTPNVGAPNLIIEKSIVNDQWIVSGSSVDRGNPDPQYRVRPTARPDKYLRSDRPTRSIPCQSIIARVPI